MNLTVIEQFADRVVGEIITDVDEIKSVLASDFARFVVRVNASAVMPEIIKPGAE